MTFHCACNIDERDCGYPDCNKGRKPLPEYVGTYQAAVSNNEGDKMKIPEGWKLVPEKGTHEMRSAFRESEKGALLSGHDHIEAFYCAYRAMLATAPTPPAEEQTNCPSKEIVKQQAGL